MRSQCCIFQKISVSHFRICIYCFPNQLWLPMSLNLLLIFSGNQPKMPLTGSKKSNSQMRNRFYFVPLLSPHACWPLRNSVAFPCEGSRYLPRCLTAFGNDICYISKILSLCRNSSQAE